MTNSIAHLVHDLTYGELWSRVYSLTWSQVARQVDDKRCEHVRAGVWGSVWTQMDAAQRAVWAQAAGITDGRVVPIDSF